MFKHGIALIVVVFLVTIAATAWSQGTSSEGKASERLITRIEVFSLRVPPESIKVSLDSQRVAYAARRGEQWLVVVDGKEGKPYDGILADTLSFSPDSQRVAYRAQRGKERFVVVDRKEGKPYDSLVRGSRIIFDSPDRLHYLVIKSADKGIDIYLVEERIKASK